MSQAVSLRSIQRSLVEALGDVHASLAARDIAYWIDGGTLLGAYRYGGFIPWDDDADMCVPRCLFPQALQALTEDLPPELQVTTQRENPMAVSAKVVILGLQGRAADGFESPVGVDIVAIDRVSRRLPRELLELSRSLAVREYSSQVPERPVPGDLWGRSWRTLWRSVPSPVVRPLQAGLRQAHRTATRAGSGALTYAIGSACSMPYYDVEWIVPLRKVAFSGLTLWGPSQPNAYLECLYGPHFASEPSAELRTGHFEDYSFSSPRPAHDPVR